MRSFASDNNSGIHPAIFEAMQRANQEHTLGYGGDPVTQRATTLFKRMFGDDTTVFFVYGGTGANVVGLASVVHPYEAVVCAETSHIYVDECNAAERFIGCRLLPVAPVHGKLEPEVIRRHLHGFGDAHHAQPKVISISQLTEFGTVYRIDEIRAIADLAHEHGMLLHMDGARIANAAAALGVEPRAFTRDAGVDVLSFGGTKNGMMYGEAVLFFNPALASSAQFVRKQGMQLASKMRFIAAQFEALLTDNLWLKNARHSNEMAQHLATQLATIPQVEITQPVDGNGIFAIVPVEVIAPLQEHFPFYVWDASINEVRWMTSFDTTPEDVDAFVMAIRQSVAQAVVRSTT